MAETYIITGAAGFIGSHLSIALLDRGCRVVGVDNFDPFYGRAAKLANIQRVAGHAHRRPGASVEMIEADIRDQRRMNEIFAKEKPAAVVHIAALAGVRPSIDDPARYVSVNLDGLTSVLEAARSAGCQRCLFASSSSVYGNNEKVPFAETDPVDDPISPYAATKRAGELICHTYAHLFDMRIAALRFFTVFGPAQRPDLAISKFMRLIAAGEEVPMFGDGTTSRDYTFIDDIVFGILAACEKVTHPPASATPGAVRTDGFFRIYNLGGSQPTTLAEMIEIIAEVVGKPARIRRLPMQPGDVERTFADLTRSAAELNFHPQTPFIEGVRRQWEWMRAQTPLQAAAT